MTNPDRFRTDPWGRVPDPGPAPIRVAVVRGALVESRHAVSCAVADAGGRIVMRWGDVAAPVFPRSAIKMLQSLPLVESGAADRFGCSPAELALACASHGGEPVHVAVVGRWLVRMGCTADTLACGAHWPLSAEATRELAARGVRPTRLHNNCAGEHAGMVATALHLGEDVTGYARTDHPVQRRIATVIADLCGVDAAAAPAGIDGCSAPTIGIPLDRMAAGLARFGAPDTLPPARAAACRRLAAAMVAAPYMVAGAGRLCTAINGAGGGRVIVKTGAEGVYAAILPERGWGLALKVADGATRAAETALVALLHHMDLVDDALHRAIAAVSGPVIKNWAGLSVGRIGVAEDIRF